MKKIIYQKILTLAVALWFGFSCFGAKTVYGSTRGRDTNDGSLKHPFLTIEKAGDVVRAKRLSGEKESLSILICGGDYYFIRSLEFGEQDKNLTIAPYKNEKVCFTGGILIDPSKARSVKGSAKGGIFPEKNRSHILMVNLRELGLTDYGELKQVGFGHPVVPSWMELFINGRPGHFLFGWNHGNNS
jgi:hypothetical protein